jgi:nucleotide-binding universal stress UspA family protein
MDSPASHEGRTLVVGVVPEQAPVVVAAAIDLARILGARLICAHVNSNRYVTRESPDGTVESVPVNPDMFDEAAPPFPEELRRRLSEALADTGVRWETRELAGDPARALWHLADRLGAELIVVGTRRPGFRGAVNEFLAGSVAAHLAHRQRRPVLVVPQAPTKDLPWEDHE